MARWPPWTTMATSHVTIYLTSWTNLDDGAWGARCGRKLARLLARERTTVSPTTTDGKCPLAFPPLPPPRVHYRTMGISRKGGGNRVDGRAFNPLSSCLAVRKCSHQRENRRDTGKRGRRKKKRKEEFFSFTHFADDRSIRSRDDWPSAWFDRDKEIGYCSKGYRVRSLRVRDRGLTCVKDQTKVRKKRWTCKSWGDAKTIGRHGWGKTGG